MTTPINLNRARKDKARADAKARADENAVKHGRTKAQRLLDAAKNDKARQMLDRHRIEDE
jgi:phage protein D